MSRISEQETLANLRKKSDEVIRKLPDCVRIYFRSMRTQNKSERTIYQYAFDLKNFFEYLQDTAAYKDKNIRSMRIDQLLDNLTKEDLQEYIETFSTYTVEKKTSKGNVTSEVISSPAYISRRISSLKAMYKYFFECGDIKANTADLLKNPKLKDKNILIMDGDEIDRILAAVETEDGLSDRQKAFHKTQKKRDKAILTLFLTTGIRISELSGIDLQDIDFKENAIRIVRKGGNEDEVFINEKVADLLKDYIETERNNLLSGHECNALFVSRQKERLKQRNIETLIKSYSEKAGLNKKITPHALRRTYGSYLYAQTDDIYLVAQVLGHRSVDTTKRYYAKMSRERKKDAAKVSESLLK